MRRALILVALLGLGACAEPPPAALAPPPAQPPEFERARLAECAQIQQTTAKANETLARQGSSIRIDMERTPCVGPPADSGVRYAKPPPPTPPRITCRTYRFKSGNSSTTCS